MVLDAGEGGRAFLYRFFVSGRDVVILYPCLVERGEQSRMVACALLFYPMAKGAIGEV